MNNLNTYVGIADAHGIESWNRKEDVSDRDRSYQIIRADANRQRHAIYYEVDVEADDAQTIEGILEDQDWILALEKLKEYAQIFRTMPNHEKSIRLIPNPDLDPWS
tara:strand:+ start:88 stop:405 length:318 start_codon:yes stop_codon:yes gene_type:complete